MSEEISKAQGFRNFLNSFDNSAELHNNFTVTWSVTGCGFGQFHFYTKDGKTYCSNENMSKEFVKKVLNAMVDNCELEDVRDENPI